MINNIYLAGASGTGKTTLGTDLARIFEMDRAQSISRGCPFPINTDEAQRWISFYTYEQAMKRTNLVMDRTPLDVCGYSRAFDLDGLVTDMARAFLFLTYKPTVIYCPIYWPAEEDGFRPTDPGLNRIVDETILSILEDNNVNYITASDSPATTRSLEVVEDIFDLDAKRNG